MRSLTRAVVVAGTFIAVSGSVRADAQIFEPLKFQTTFPFTVEQMTFPAGKYTLRPAELDPGIMEISDGKTTKLITVEPAGVPSSDPKIKDDEVLFTKRGDTYVLSEIWDAAERAGVEPIPSANHDTTTAVAAHHSRHHHAV